MSRGSGRLLPLPVFCFVLTSRRIYGKIYLNDKLENYLSFLPPFGRRGTYLIHQEYILPLNWANAPVIH